MRAQEFLQEVQILSRVKGKGAEPSRLPRLGREIPLGQEEQYLGRYVADIRPGQQLWRQYVSGEVNYHFVEVYGYDTRTGEMLNIGAADEEMYAVPAGAALGRDAKYVAKNIRLVTTAR